MYFKMVRLVEAEKELGVNSEVSIRLLQKFEEIHTKEFNEFKEYYR